MTTVILNLPFQINIFLQVCVCFCALCVFFAYFNFLKQVLLRLSSSPFNITILLFPINTFILNEILHYLCVCFCVLRVFALHNFFEASTFPGQLPICSFTWHQFVLVCTICLPAYCLVSPQLWFGLKTRGHDSGWETRHLLARRSRYSPPARWWHKMGMTKMSSSDVRMSVIHDYGNIEYIKYMYHEVVSTVYL